MAHPILFPHLDESFHSFVLRICMLYGGKNIPKIISPKGNYWQKEVFLNDDISPYFLKYTDKQLIHLMRNSGFAQKSTKMFDYPNRYTLYLNRFFKGKHARIKHYSYYPKDELIRKPIQYCIDCIRESTIKNGFGYFRAEWFARTYHDFCHIHKKALYTLTESSREIGMKNLALILKGHNPNEAKIITQAPYPYNNPISRAKKTNLPTIHMSVCLHYKLKKWLLNNTHSFPQSVADAARIRHVSSINTVHRNSQMLKNFYLERVVKAMLQAKYEPFMTFWNENVARKILYCGVINEHGLHERVYVCKGVDCQLCTIIDEHYCITKYVKQEHISPFMQGYYDSLK